MAMLTLGQAAKDTGLSKTAIARAIKSGRLSANRTEQGEYQIDPAELFRVYPVTGNRYTSPEPSVTPTVTAGLPGESPGVTEPWLRELLRQVEGERDDLRRRLDHAEAARERDTAELRRLTLLLTDQRPPPAAPPVFRPAVFWAAAAFIVALAVLVFWTPGPWR